MKRTALAFSVLAAVGGCMSAGGDSGPDGPGTVHGPNAVMPGPATVPYAMGPGGAPVNVRASGMASAAPSPENAARETIARQIPPELMPQVDAEVNGSKSGIRQVAGFDGPPPGMMPPPPGAGLMPPGGFPNAAVAAVGALTGHYGGQFAAARTSVRFLEPNGMKISWMIPSPDGKRVWNDKPLETPATYNFTQAAIYRLKLSDIPGYPGVDLYPTLEVVPAKERAMTFLAHSSVPVSFTAEDFRMVNAGNYVVKVIYLPDPQYQDIAVGGGIGELISTQLQPGEDPIAEATKRGSILLIVRLGNIDLELRHSPPMDAPPPHPAPPPGWVPPGAGPGRPMMGPPAGMMPPLGSGLPPVNPGAGPQAPTGGPPLGALPPLPPQTNPQTPAQLAGQGVR